MLIELYIIASISDATISESEAQVLVAMVGIIPATLAAFFAYRGAAHARAANDAVNHTHKSGKKRILDQVEDIGYEVKKIREDTTMLIDWKESYEGGPWADGKKAREFMEEYREIAEDVEQLKEEAER